MLNIVRRYIRTPGRQVVDSEGSCKGHWVLLSGISVGPDEPVLVVL